MEACADCGFVVQLWHNVVGLYDYTLLLEYCPYGTLQTLLNVGCGGAGGRRGVRACSGEGPKRATIHFVFTYRYALFFNVVPLVAAECVPSSHPLHPLQVVADWRSRSGLGCWDYITDTVLHLSRKVWGGGCV